MTPTPTCWGWAGGMQGHVKLAKQMQVVALGCDDEHGA